MLSRRNRSVLFAAGVLVAYAATLLIAGRASGVFVGGDRYDLGLWIARNLARTWLNQPARRLGGGIAPASDADVAEFFRQASAVDAAERDVAYAEATGMPAGGFEQDLETRLAASRDLQRPVELRLASELSRTAADTGLTLRLPVYRRVALVWPPVSFAYDFPPLLLIRSPRNRIELTDATLLRSDLSPADVRAIEARTSSNTDSSLVVRIGGLAAYPSLVEEDGDYRDGLELVAHEWTHQYLAFHPLGARYFESSQLTILNETVANLVGMELAALMQAAYPEPPTTARIPSTAPPPDRAFDFDRTMHELRLNVDALLAQGQTAEAEQQMDSTWHLLADHGYYVPRINQAYFAFFGSYGNTAEASSPLGPQLATLRGHYGNLRDFVTAVQNLRGPDDLQRLLNASAR